MIQGAKGSSSLEDPSSDSINNMESLLHASRQAPLVQEVMDRLTDTVQNLTVTLASSIDIIRGSHHDVSKLTANATTNIELHNTAFKSNLDRLKKVVEKFPLSDPIKGVPDPKGKDLEEETTKSSSSSQMQAVARAPVEE